MVRRGPPARREPGPFGPHDVRRTGRELARGGPPERAPDAAGRDRLEPRAVHPVRAPAVGPAVGLYRPVRPARRDGRVRGRRAARTRGAPRGSELLRRGHATGARTSWLAQQPLAPDTRLVRAPGQAARVGLSDAPARTYTSRPPLQGLYSLTN